MRHATCCPGSAPELLERWRARGAPHGPQLIAGVRRRENVPLLFKHFWIAFILVTLANGAIWWFRGRPHRERDPALTDGYRSLVRGLITWGNVPWLIMGAGILFGGVPSISHFFNLKSSNPFIIAFYMSIFLIWLAGTYWIFARGGAEQLVRHPGLVQGPLSTPVAVKVLWLACLASGVAAVIIMPFLPTCNRLASEMVCSPPNAMQLTVRPGTRLADSAAPHISPKGGAQGARPSRPAADRGRWADNEKGYPPVLTFGRESYDLQGPSSQGRKNDPTSMCRDLVARRSSGLSRRSLLRSTTASADVM